MTEQYQQASINLGGKGYPSTQLVYAPAASPSDSGYVFNDFKDLYLKFKETPGIIDIVFDFSSGLPPSPGIPPEFRSFPIPEDVYDFENRAAFVAAPSNILSIAIPESGVEIRNLIGIFGGVGVFNSTASPIIRVSGDASFLKIFVLREGAALAVAPGSAPCISLDNAVLALDNADIIDPLLAGSGIVEVVSGSFSVIAIVSSLSVLDPNVLIGDATATLAVVIGSPSVDVDTVNQANFLGSIVEILNQTSTQQLYAPSNIADWSGASPENVAAALDRIASSIGPIP